MLFWDYINKFHQNCIHVGKFDVSCSEEVLKNLKIPSDNIQKCYQDSFIGEKKEKNYELYLKNNILDSEYELRKKNFISKLKKLMSDLELAEKNMKELEYIYSKEKKEEKDNIKTINNNKGLSKKIFHFPEKKYIIEFNNERNEKFFENNLKIPSNNKNKKK